MDQCSIGQEMQTCTRTFKHGSNVYLWFSNLRFDLLMNLRRCEYLKYWLGKEGLPLIERWTKTGKIPTAEPGDAGNKLETYWTLLKAECKPKGN